MRTGGLVTPLVTLTAAELRATGPLAVACPVCLAPAGEACLLRGVGTLAGTAIASRPHLARRELVWPVPPVAPVEPAPRKPVRRAPTLQVTGTTPEQQQRWKDAAARQDMTLAAWMRAACDKFASSDT